MHVLKIDKFIIKDNELVRFKDMKNIKEIMYMEKEPTGLSKIQKINKFEYVTLEDGEIHKYNLSVNRGENVNGLRDTFKKIRDLINNNFEGLKNELHITLTYAENMTDTKRLYTDFKAFWKRLRYKYGDDVDYLTVVEPQGRGAWHHHLLIRFNSFKSVFLPSDDVAKLWGNGYITVKSLDGIDNIGAYLSAYLGDIELTPDNLKEIREIKQDVEIELKEVDLDGLKKSFIKGGRCHLYPVGMNIYRKSKGIIVPEVQKMTYKDAKKIVGNVTSNYSSSTQILSDELKTYNTIQYQQYNIKRV